jgi:hypothetical protein
MGWGRCSCKFCIFGNKNQFAGAAKTSPEQMKELIRIEKEFACTINRKYNLEKLIESGNAYENITTESVTLATNSIYNQQIIIPLTEQWILPAGAFGENCGSM